MAIFDETYTKIASAILIGKKSTRKAMEAIIEGKEKHIRA
jgi:hypothetical protein